MSYRVSRKCTSTSFTVGEQLCKVFLTPVNEYRPGFWLWNVGFAVGKSRRQLNDWNKGRRNKRRRSIANRLVGTSGIKTISKGFKTVLQMRWTIQPGDAIVLDCTSKDPEKQFKTWMRWAPSKKHPEWTVDFEAKEFYWYRPPYPSDPVWNQFRITGVIPEDPLDNTAESRYYDCFRVWPKLSRQQGSPCNDLSMSQISDLLSQALNSQPLP